MGEEPTAGAHSRQPITFTIWEKKHSQPLRQWAAKLTTLKGGEEPAGEEASQRSDKNAFSPELDGGRCAVVVEPLENKQGIVPPTEVYRMARSD